MDRVMNVWTNGGGGVIDRSMNMCVGGWIDGWINEWINMCDKYEWINIC